MRRSMLFVLLVVTPVFCHAGGEPLTFDELLKVRTIHDLVLAEDGSWSAWQQVPDRGDGEVVVRSTVGKTEYRIPLGASPEVSVDGRFVAAVLEPSFVEIEEADDDDPPKSDLVLLNTSDGTTRTWERVQGFGFSADGRWLVIHHHEAEEDEDDEDEVAEDEREIDENDENDENDQTDETEDDDAPEPRIGTLLRLLSLDDGHETEVVDVEAFAVSEVGAFVAWAVAAEDLANRLMVRDLASADGVEIEITTAEGGRYSHLSWAGKASSLGFVAAIDDHDGEPGEGSLWVWQGASGEAIPVSSNKIPAGWWIPSANRLRWTADGARLFFGLKPESERPEKMDDSDDEKIPDPEDLDALLKHVTLDVWHVNDPLIKTNVRQEWEEKERDRVYLAVWHADDGRLIHLTDTVVRNLVVSEAPRGAVALADTPYLREITWDGWFADLYWVDLASGRRVRLAERLAEPGSASVSPDGRQVSWYRAPHWYLWDLSDGLVRNLTENLAESFADEENDQPEAPSSYGSAGWLADGSAFIVSDRWDLWSLPIDGPPENITGGTGREQLTTFKRIDLEPDSPWIPETGPFLVEAFAQADRNDGFYRLDREHGKLEPLLAEEGRLAVRVVAEQSDRLIFTREDYRVFPDLWVSNHWIESPRRLSNANPDLLERFAWGNSELVSWTSADGVGLEGVLIRPENLHEGELCPVLTYFYSHNFSDRLHLFNEPVVNHRPSFPVYASHGYCVFLPDVHFEVGRPGLSAVKALVPGLQKLVDLGIADPDALGLHGHSWSGYQAAFVVTQTELFAAVVAGAPVSNMTSAYGGIRLESGLARQFQYESSQSRIGASLWQRRDLYIENSPLFYVDRINTPLLIQHGDEDEAVPWSESVQLYLALRRLDKEAVFLQYRGEPHHLKQQANQLDYSIKMKQFFDHHLKGAPAPTWWTEGVVFKDEG